MGTREKIKTIVARFSVATPTPSKAFFLVCVAMLFGAMLGLWVIGFSFISYVIAWSSVIGFVCALYKWPRWALFFAVAAAFSFGFVRSSVARQMADPLLPFADGIVHIVSGIVYQPPQAQRRSVRFSIQTFSVDGIRQSAMLTVVAEPFPVIRAGDVLELRCTFTDEMKGRRPVAPVCLFPDVDIVRHESIGWRGILPAARDGVAERIDEAFPEPVAGFVRGLLLGGSTRLPEILREALLTTGTVHLVALSGFNITIIAAFLLYLLRFVAAPRKLQPFIIGLGLIGFVCAVGAQASLVRAAIMGMLVVVSSALGRPSAARNAIVFAAVVMVLVDPFILTDDIGFQLSFLATIGIVIFYPRLEVYAESLPTLFGVREAFLLTVSAQLLVTPLLVWHFGRLSFIAPIVNAVVAPFIPFIMLFGALGAAGAFIAVPLGQLLGLPAWMASQFVLWIIQYTAQVPYAAVLVPAVSIIPLFIVNGVVIWYLLRRPVFLIANK